MIRGLPLRALCIFSLSLLACGGRSIISTRVADAEKVRGTLVGRDAQSMAPQAFAMADQELRLARDAAAGGDKTGAELHADRAVAAYAHATILARLSRATQDEASANEALARASEQIRRFSAQRTTLDRESSDLEKKIRIAREMEVPPSSGPADSERMRARLVAAQSLAMQARLLCSAARLVSPDAPGLAEADAAVESLEKDMETGKAKAPIDAAARVRAACLASLTKARRSTATTSDDQGDALLGELSQSVAAPTTASRPRSDLAPSRDERGVVVTLHGAFQGDVLSRDAEASVKELGRVSAAHPDFGVQVVIHDAHSPSASGDKKHGEAVVRALVDGGAPSARVKVEQAGTRAPLVDLRDARGREHNARLEIVFVVTGS
ncbi:MAG: hypothetical protein FWD69_19685 [Polyangiaceae bacterium]|nr:hypothetical protein [Polyangiaceae bacterium]